MLAFSETLWLWADAVMDIVGTAHREVELEQAREEQQRRDAFVFALLTGTLDAGELRLQSATFGLDADRMAEVGERPRDVAAFIEEALVDYSPATVNLDVSILCDIYNTAVRQELVERNPALRAERPRMPRKRSRILEPAEVGKVAKAFAEEEYRVVFLTFVLTGLRRFELRALRWRDVDLVDAVLRVRASKTEEGIRSIAISPTLLDALLSRGRALDVLDGCRAPPAAGHKDRDPDQEDDDPHDEQDPARGVDVEPARAHGDRERHDRADDTQHNAERDESGSCSSVHGPRLLLRRGAFNDPEPRVVRFNEGGLGSRGHEGPEDRSSGVLRGVRASFLLARVRIRR